MAHIGPSSRASGGGLRRGFSLIELVVSLVIMSMLMGGMASAIVLASHAIPDGSDGSLRSTAAANAIEMMAEDLALASLMLGEKKKSVRFKVPDRGHGAVGEETIRYMWSGVAGDPLQRRYNGTTVDICDDVYDLTLDYHYVAGPLDRAPRVLMVVRNDGSLTNDERDRRDLMESWGCTVDVLNDDDGQTTLDDALEKADVLYICETVAAFSSGLDGRIRNWRRGIVSEEHNLSPTIGFCADGGGGWFYDNLVDIVDPPHVLTDWAGAGMLAVCDWDQELYWLDPPYAPGLQVLGERSWGDGAVVLAVIDAGGRLYDGDLARGRRVKLPWGGDTFDFDILSPDGHELMRTSIEWAAATPELYSVRITLQHGSDARSTLEIEVPLLNRPEGDWP